MTSQTREFTPLDRLILNLDRGIRTLFGRPQTTARPNPAGDLPESELDDRQRRLVAGLMRVDHTGEVCAQALYQGQSLTARDPQVRAALEQSALEENDHLLWCDERLQELHGHTSYLNPFWYTASLGIGIVAGLAGDDWSLGFLAETEYQVIRHLESHLQRLPQQDSRSRTILLQMMEDEAHHATVAVTHGASTLPAPVQVLMKLQSRVMTGTAYWV